MDIICQCPLCSCKANISMTTCKANNHITMNAHTGKHKLKAFQFYIEILPKSQTYQYEKF